MILVISYFKFIDVLSVFARLSFLFFWIKELDFVMNQTTQKLRKMKKITGLLFHSCYSYLEASGI